MSITTFLGLGYYTSPLDQFLKDFDQAHPDLSAAQKQELDKYKKIFKLRDDASDKKIPPDFWEKF
jgi:hypothetical protein